MEGAQRETFRRLAKMQFGPDGQDVSQFTEWGSSTHDVTGLFGVALHDGVTSPPNVPSTYKRHFPQAFGAPQQMFS